MIQLAQLKDMNEKQDLRRVAKDEFDILMPAFNAARTIAESIRSVQNQTHPDWQLWVIDDGSSDNTAAVVEEFLSDARIHLLRQVNRKQGAARNFGLKQGNGEWVCFLDADDLWNPDKLEKQKQALIESCATVTFSDGDIFWEDDDSLHHTFETLRGYFTGAEMLPQLLLINRVPILSACVQRQVLEAANGFEESEIFHGVEDYDLWIRLAQSGASFYGIDGVLVRYRRHAQAMTLDASPKNTLAENAVWERHFDAAIECGLEADITHKIRVNLHGVALKLVRLGQKREAFTLLQSAQSRKWDDKYSPLKRIALKITPRLYVKVYAGLHAIKNRLRSKS